MEKIEQKPLLPYITLEEVYAFDPQKPETFTESRFVNAVLEAMMTVCPSTALPFGLSVAAKKPPVRRGLCNVKEF